LRAFTPSTAATLVVCFDEWEGGYERDDTELFSTLLSTTAFVTSKTATSFLVDTEADVAIDF